MIAADGFVAFREGDTVYLVQSNSTSDLFSAFFNGVAALQIDLPKVPEDDYAVIRRKKLEHKAKMNRLGRAAFRIREGFSRRAEPIPLRYRRINTRRYGQRLVKCRNNRVS